MNDMLFVTGLGAVLLCLMGWGFKHLPGERWQMLAVIPLKKSDGDGWLGVNLTYYGFFIATSQLIALMLLLVLLNSIDVSLKGAMTATLVVLGCCLPAARLVAILVENKRHTFTIGGASFVGIILAPWAILAAEKFLGGSEAVFMPLLPLLAAMSIAYTLGEGLGRLGCISYGCCYGKPIEQSGRLLRFFFSRLHFIFHGDNKKVAYEGKLHGQKLIPIQAITCLLYTAGALCGSWLFLKGSFVTALVLTMALTQLWRIISETMRADFRGLGKISVYQKMGVVSVFYVALLCLFMKEAPVIVPDVAGGIDVLWNPAVIFGLQILWLVFFLFFGRSTVTTSKVSFVLLKENI